MLITKVNGRFAVGGGVPAGQYADLAVRCVTHIINVAQELDDQSGAVANGLRYWKINWQDDGTAKPLQDFLATLGWVTQEDQSAVFNGRPMPLYYIHCAAGVNRSVAMATFLMAAVTGWDATDCFYNICLARPIANGYRVPAYRKSVDEALERVRLGGGK